MTAHPPERQRLEAHQRIARHRHDQAYVAVVLAGGYEEAGDAGRRRLTAGEAAVHDVFAGHLNGVGARGAVVLNLPADGLAGGFGRVADPDALVRAAERDPAEALAMLRETLAPLDAQALDWPDDLARDLIADPQLSLRDWARDRGLAPETLSRGFGRVFGVTPKRFRYEGRAQRMLHALKDGQTPLADLALEAGFSDQAHMGHAVAELTGVSPGAWRARSSPYKTGG